MYTLLYTQVRKASIQPRKAPQKALCPPSVEVTAASQKICTTKASFAAFATQACL
jgi:hypothetical protein